MRKVLNLEELVCLPIRVEQEEDHDDLSAFIIEDGQGGEDVQEGLAEDEEYLPSGSESDSDGEDEVEEEEEEEEEFRSDEETEEGSDSEFSVYSDSEDE